MRFSCPPLLLLLLLGAGLHAVTTHAAADTSRPFEHRAESLPETPSGPGEATWAIAAGSAWVFRSNEIHTLDLSAQPRSWHRVPVPLPADFTQPLGARSAGGFVLIDRATGAGAGVRIPPDGQSSVTILPKLDNVQRVHALASSPRYELFVAATAGGDTSQSVIFHLAAAGDGTFWQQIATVDPGIGTPVALAAQSNGITLQVYAYGTRGFSALDLRTRQWTPLPAPVRGDDPSAEQHSTLLLAPVGIAHLYLLTPGSPAGLVVFNTITRQWTEPRPWAEPGTPVAFSSDATRFSTLLVHDDARATWLNTEYTVRAHGLHRMDYIIIAGFLGALVTMAVLNRRRFQTVDSYFRGGKNIPWLAAGLSVVATGQSATSFISIPARSFATNWQFALVPLTNVFGALIMSRYFVRFFVRLNITSGYEYLQVRFSPLIRTIGSLNYLCYELARISLLILVPAVAVAAVAKVDLPAAILTMGAVTTVYTSLGGLEGVVWADVVQISLKVFAILGAAVLIFANLEGSIPELASTAWHAGKLQLVDWSFSFTRDTIWAFILFWLTDGLKSYVANQTIIQRYVSTRDENAAKRSIQASAWVGTLISWTFLLTGTGLFLFYHQNPDRFDLTVDKPDAVFPWFIVFELPPGVVGLLITALIAAAFSSLYGALNSTSTVVVTDFYRRFVRSSNDAGALRLGKQCTVFIGIISTGVSLTLAGLASRSLVEQTLSVIGLFGGGLGGLFLVGMLTTRVSARSALAGFLVSAAVQYIVSRHTPLHWLTYMFTGMGSCFVASYLASFIWPERRRLEGLTVHTYR